MPLAAKAQQAAKIGRIGYLASNLAAQHAFDVSELPAKMTYRFGTIGYDPQAATAAQREIEKFLKPAN